LYYQYDVGIDHDCNSQPQNSVIKFFIHFHFCLLVNEMLKC